MHQFGVHNFTRDGFCSTTALSPEKRGLVPGSTYPVSDTEADEPPDFWNIILLNVMSPGRSLLLLIPIPVASRTTCAFSPDVVASWVTNIEDSGSLFFLIETHHPLYPLTVL
jgi:hypothetical protein